MNKTDKNTTAPQKSRNKARIAAIIVTVLLLGLALFFSVFEVSTVRQVQDIADKKEQSAWTQFMGNVFITYAVHKQQKSQECVYIFSEDELNAVCNMAVRNYNEKHRPHTICFVQVKNGTVQVDVSRKKLGLHLNFRLVTIPEIKDGKVAIKVDSARAGKIPLPASLVEKKIAQAVARQLKKPEVALVASKIRAAGFTPENNYKLVIDSKAVRQVMKSFR